MLGIDKLKVENEKHLTLSLNIDEDNILEMSSRKGINFVRILFLTIGQKSDQVCKSCDNFIFRNECVNQCP